jgi:integrase
VWPRDLESFKGGKFNTLSLVDCYVQIFNGTAVEYGSLLNCSGVCDGINCYKSVVKRLYEQKRYSFLQIYTNHSIRATGATILGRNCSMAQIMAVTGHKSASSVAVYQRVSSKEKQVMGDIITSSVRGEQPSS